MTSHHRLRQAFKVLALIEVQQRIQALWHDYILERVLRGAGRAMDRLGYREQPFFSDTYVSEA